MVSIAAVVGVLVVHLNVKQVVQWELQPRGIRRCRSLSKTSPFSSHYYLSKHLGHENSANSANISSTVNVANIVNIVNIAFKRMILPLLSFTKKLPFSSSQLLRNSTLAR